MKKMLLIWVLSGMFFSATMAQYDDAFPTGYEGDNFSLEGALDIFKNSSSIKQFERKLNTRDNWVNNLDLDFDGRTDYIRVEHKRQGDFHAIILQAIVGSWELQDVAVIEIEKVSRRDAILQIIGDEDLYGEEIIVEAYDRNTLVRDRRYRPSYSSRVSYVNVYNWSSVQYIFRPNYVTYVSPFYHHYYPTWWSPWNRCGWDIFRPRVRHYQAFYRPVRVHRVRNVHDFYRPHRTYCNAVVRNSNKVRAKHGRRTIERPRVDRNEVERKRSVVAKANNRDRGAIRRNNSSDNRVASSKRTRISSRPSIGSNRKKEPKRSTSYTSTKDRRSVSTKSTRGKTQARKSRTEPSAETRSVNSRNTTRTNSSSNKSYSSRSNSKPSVNRKTSKKVKSSNKRGGITTSRSNSTSLKKKNSRSSNTIKRSFGKNRSSAKKSTRIRRQ